MSQDPAQDADAVCGVDETARMVIDTSSSGGDVPAVSDFALLAVSNMSSAELQASHHKRLAQILRYLATIHRGGGGGGGSANSSALADYFMREYPSLNDAKEAVVQEFDMTGQSNDDTVEVGGDSPLLFSLGDFQSISASASEAGLFSSPPFSFYAASASSSAAGTSPTARARKFFAGNSPAASCWLRLTRIKPEEPPTSASPAVQHYLESWASQRKHRSYKRLVRSLDALNHAPAVDASMPARKQKEIRAHLKKCKRYVKRDSIRRKLEPLYNRLFEIAQTTKAADAFEELILGLGNARMIGNDDGGGDGDGNASVINGPLLEIRVEVELAPDGALLVRPCEHIGVELNRDVVGALSTDREVISSLHRAVGEMETMALSPGQPGTYSAMLKRIAVEISSGGRFVSTQSSAYANVNPGRSVNRLLVTDAWCFYHRPKPSSVWARDAQTLADLVSKQQAAGSRSLLSSIQTPPMASLSLTHGPNALQGVKISQPPLSTRFTSSVKSLFGWSTSTSSSERPLFPLPSSASQLRIHQLLSEGAPAVVVEGPPGCGKTHAIANIVCSYLAQGKRVLVTSKGAPALSVLRKRLPPCMQELVVDVTVSEAEGMQQLQQTVERLAEKVSRGIDKSELCQSLSQNIKTIETGIAAIDAKLESFHRRKSTVLQSSNGHELVEQGIDLVEKAPWLVSAISELEDTQLMDFIESVESLASDRTGYHDVSGYDTNAAPSSALISGTAARAGGIVPSFTGVAVHAVSSLPLIGSFSGARTYYKRRELEVDDLELSGDVPSSKSDWIIVHSALVRNSQHWSLYEKTISALIDKEGWPRDEVYDDTKERLCFKERFVDLVRMAGKVRKLQAKTLRQKDFDQPYEAQRLEAQRQKLKQRLEDLDNKLVEARVITQLSSMFSPEAQSALIQFAQLAGKAKFRSNAQASKLTARQQRHRQAYLSAFEKCVRYIPCWICTSNQVNDYLPAEFGLFDLCVMDEASQSDITALPAMVRGKQWMIVGDGRQVSPTESFTAEAQIESLRASLPDSPFRECFLPGHSFFDLCSQAYPIGRVVLTEHFRCAPEIIQFSNETYYQGRLQPLRLPTSSEIMSPSLVDIYVRNGRKIGKTNEAEADKIVSMIKDMIDQSNRSRRSRPKSIGVISLVGDEQSRLIRGRLLDVIGPEAYNLHDILVGEPPSFQGSERDVVFLSMVSSPGSVPTQSQLMYHQRINVALSRARDRMVLVRSINRSHVPSNEDAKVAVIDYFSEEASNDIATDTRKRGANVSEPFIDTYQSNSVHSRVVESVSGLLVDAGFEVRPMGVVWKGSICVENASSGARAAISIENGGEVEQEWATTLAQQRAIERVGWQCARVDALSWLLDLKATHSMLISFLKSAGVSPKKHVVHLPEEMEEEIEEDNDQIPLADEDNEVGQEEAASNNVREAVADDVVVISTDDEGEDYMSDTPHADKLKEEDDDDDDSGSDDDDDGYDPQSYGAVIQLGVPARKTNRSSLADSDDEFDEESDLDVKPKAKGKRKRDEPAPLNVKSDDIHSNSDDESDASDDDRPKPSPIKRRKQSSGGYKSTGDASDEDYEGDESNESDHGDAMSEEDLEDNTSNTLGERKHRRRYKRLDSHSRDGRWYPSYAPDNGDVPMEGAEDESWDDLKDVVSSDSSYNNDGGPSITSRLRSSVPSQEMNNIEQSQEQGEDDVEESSVVPVENVLGPIDVTPIDAVMVVAGDVETSEEAKMEQSIISSEITIPNGYDARDEVSLL
mmetsp:Transcript_19947/g.57299  ORF Transcript_19947/g.57299 Transcript_19947/m.57299 type:complete len:1755 (+) Transcript_19947:297-5561(+)